MINLPEQSSSLALTKTQLHLHVSTASSPAPLQSVPHSKCENEYSNVIGQEHTTMSWNHNSLTDQYWIDKKYEFITYFLKDISSFLYLTVLHVCKPSQGSLEQKLLSVRIKKVPGFGSLLCVHTSNKPLCFMQFNQSFCAMASSSALWMKVLKEFCIHYSWLFHSVW